MSEALRATFRRVLRLENRRGVIRPGRLEHISGFRSGILRNSREVTVYLPPGYDENTGRRYPLLLMQDGQNLFDADRAYVPGQHWRMQDAADAAIGERTAEAVIIAGIDHAGVGRLDEYTPSRDPKHEGGGKAGEYGRMLVEELMPTLAERFRILGDAGNTAVGGSSLGGLVSLHLGLTRPEAFGRVAAMSPSVWWANRTILDEVDRYDGPAPRLWLDVGGREGAEALRDVRLLRDRVAAKRWDADRFGYYEDRRGDHSERAWARRARMMLEFLFPAA